MQVQQSSVQKPQSHKQHPGQSVFKVRKVLLNHPSTASGTPTTSPAPGTGNTFHPRKSHRKSRTGCKNCKLRRIKCDEQRDGGCRKCRDHGLECDYLVLQTEFPEKDTKLRKGPGSHCQVEQKNTVVGSLVYSQADTLASLSLAPSMRPVLPVSLKCSEAMTDPLAVLYHFNTLTLHTCGSPQGQAIIQSYVLNNLVMQTPYLLHALLGVAASHMAYLLPADVNTVQNAKHKLADAYHWGHALRLFREELSVKGAHANNMDALLSTVMLVAIYQFVLREGTMSASSGTHSSCSERWKQSFVFIEDHSERAEAMKWLSIQAGFKVLLNQLWRHIPNSIWMPVFEDASLHDNPEGDAQGKTWEQATPHQDPDRTETLLCGLCNIDDTSNERNNPYYAGLEVLLHVRRMRPVAAKHFNKIITFMGRVSPEFRQLLLDRDSAALLILAHWLSLVLDLRQWWLSERAEEECRAIVIYLEGRATEKTDESVRTLLQEPAQAVGVEI